MPTDWKNPAMRFVPLGSVLALLVALDGFAWLAFVPGRMTGATFAGWNLGIVCLFMTGVASAANGLPTPQIAQRLYEAEQRKGRW
jgi:hypothetical protein